MSFSNVTVGSNAAIIPVDTRVLPKVLFLPTVSTNSGRYLCFKDYYGTASNSSFTISTTGTDLIDDYNWRYTFSNAFGGMTFVSDGLRSWRTMDFYNGSNTPAAPSTFTPTSLPGLTIWLDGSYSSSVILSGANVTAWNDRSGNGWNVSNVGTVTTSNLNGSNVINFGTSRMASTSSFPWRTKFAQFYVGRLASANTGGMLVSHWSGGYVSYTYSANNALMSINGTGFNDAVGTPSIAANTWFIWTIGYNNGTNGTPYALNGTPRTTTTVVPRVDSTPTATLYLNGNGNNQFDTSLMAEFIQYNDTLTLAQSQQVEGYLAWKWGLQGNLPSNHPYKNAPP